MDKFITPLIPIMVWIGTGLLLKTRKKNIISDTTGRYVLSYSSGMKIFAICAALFWYIVLIGFIFNSDESPLVTWIFGVVITLMLLPLIIEFFGVFHIISQEGIEKHSPWSRSFFVKWEDVNSISFNPTMQWFVINSSRGIIRLHLWLDGLKNFTDSVKKSLPKSKWEHIVS